MAGVPPPPPPLEREELEAPSPSPSTASEATDLGDGCSSDVSVARSLATTLHHVTLGDRSLTATQKRRLRRFREAERRSQGSSEGLPN